MKLSRVKKIIALGFSLLSVSLAVSACTDGVTAVQEPQAEKTVAAQYHKITAEEAKAVMDSGEPMILLDVREQSEFDSGHIPNAVLLPSGSVAAMAAEALPDKDAKILVYCRSGSRSRTAANTLVGMGYTQVYDIGGIIDWPYDVVK